MNCGQIYCQADSAGNCPKCEPQPANSDRMAIYLSFDEASYLVNLASEDGDKSNGQFAASVEKTLREQCFK